MTQKIDQYYAKSNNVVFEDGEWWYVSPATTGFKYRERLESHARKNRTRMFVNGKYIPKSHPLHKPGNFKSLDDAWSHKEINSVPQGYVYAIINQAWPEWVKIGSASIAEDRLNGYQTSSPFRDYEIVCTFETKDKRKAETLMHRTLEQYADERRNEWFKIDIDKVKDMFYHYDDSVVNNQ
jgi:hypothetical protein